MSRRKMGRGSLLGDVNFDESEAATSDGGSPISLEDAVEQGLFDKREQVIEKALSQIIEAFTTETQHKIAETKFATIMLRCLNFIKKGSAKEIRLATKAIGLLAMILGPGDNAHELYQESLSTYSQTLNFEAQSEKVLECLAIVTLVGAEDFWETEISMKSIWQFIHPKSGSDAISDKASAPVLAAAISAWSFILTTIDGQSIDHKYWQGAISYLLNLVEEGEECVQAACVEALAIIFEKGCVEKFSSEAYNTFINSYTNQEDTTSCLREWKEKIVEQVERKCGSKWEVLKLFEDECKLKNSMYICGNSLMFSTWSELKKIKFIKQFLGGGFELHMMENELLHQVFDFKPKEAPPGPEIYVPETEKGNIRYFTPDVRRELCKQRFERSPNSLVSKARTQLMKKHRLLAQERKAGYVAC